jgi:hypothetical protein
MKLKQLFGLGAAQQGTAEKTERSNLSFDGSGRVSVSVRDLIKSPRVQRHVESVREIAHSATHQKQHS